MAPGSRWHKHTCRAQSSDTAAYHKARIKDFGDCWVLWGWSDGHVLQPMAVGCCHREESTRRCTYRPFTITLAIHLPLLNVTPRKLDTMLPLALSQVAGSLPFWGAMTSSCRR